MAATATTEPTEPPKTEPPTTEHTTTEHMTTQPADDPNRHTAGYSLSLDPARIDLTRVHHWLSTDSYWAAGRTLETMRRALEGSVPAGAYDAGGAQVAFARAITDRATFAYLADVYVDGAHRGRGLGTRLVGALRDHLAGLGVRRFLLVTRDAHHVYARLGFTDVEPGRWMEQRLQGPVN
jgi:GNAT superfamily N-acetyltransferase